MTKKIFLDAGHGGKDPGAVGNGLQEKNLTLTIVKKIQKLLVNGYEDVSVKLSRTGDTYPSLSARADAANDWGADLFASIHINAGGGTGFETLRYNTLSASSSTGKMQATVHDAIFAELKKHDKDMRDRGKKSANLAVLRETSMQAILTETLFIDTKADATLLKKDDFLDSVALGHVKGFAKVLGLKAKKVETPKTEEAPKGKLYRVQCGAFSKKTGAESLQASLKAKGFDTLIVKEDEYYKVQCGAFSVKDNADKLSAQLKAKGFTNFVKLS